MRYEGTVISMFFHCVEPVRASAAVRRLLGLRRARRAARAGDASRAPPLPRARRGVSERLHHRPRPRPRLRTRRPARALRRHLSRGNGSTPDTVSTIKYLHVLSTL